MKSTWSNRFKRLFDNNFRIPEFTQWRESNFSSPVPKILKLEVLKRWGGLSVWIETGTFKGDTTLALSKFSSHVYTIEPDFSLYSQSSNRLKAIENVTVIHGLSEEILIGVLNRLVLEEVRDISFYLDGHFSGGITHKGPIDTPIREELSLIGQQLKYFQEVTVLIDDVRCFNPENPENSDYPSLKFLVDWSVNLDLYWTIEYDIFIATNRKNRPYLPRHSIN